MNCKNVQQKLIFFAENDLSTLEAVNVGKHLEGCSDCNLLYEELRETLGVIEKEKEFRVNPFFATRVEQRLANLKEKEILLSQSVWLVRLTKLVPVALSLVLAVWLGINLGINFSQTPAQTTVSQVSDTTFYFEEFMQEDLYAGTIESVLMINGDKN
ncbi:MAG: zf-HC2 domain-containing protein [Bacteroidales bacterium]|nr:zf-HC2 domain-containing protein [Bacteroidales bacterium]MDZ4204163.1 zf-HC2 domain-containing protein [Bacteroidales bacterium]